MKLALTLGVLALLSATTAKAQAWQNCIPASIAPGGCESIAPGGGRSIAPGGGESIGPGGGRSIGPYGGQSIGPGGGLSIAPGGGLAPDRNINRGFDTRTMQPFPGANPYAPGAAQMPTVQMPQLPQLPQMPCVGLYC